MTLLSESQLAELLLPFSGHLSPQALTAIGIYLDLIVRWNAKTNLTAVREPAALVQRQIGESLFAAPFLRQGASLLDFGSGAGFPGIPLKIARPDLKVTLAESQGKKASFLREALRSLCLDAELWPSRVESMPEGRIFDIVAMRAVDHTAEMLPVAKTRVATGGVLLRYLAAEDAPSEDWKLAETRQLPLSQGRLTLWKKP